MLLVIGGGCFIAVIILCIALVSNANVFLDHMYNGGN